MNSASLLALIGGVAVTEFLSLSACFQAVFPAEPTSPVPRIDNSVVAMADGSVMIAAPGTISRDVIDWFNDPSASPRQFVIGRQPFDPNSDRPAPEAEVRLARLATELGANPDVTATIVVCGSGKSAMDGQLAAARARRLAQDLAGRQVDSSRISTQTCRQAVPAGLASASQQDGQRIGILLSRDD